MIPVGMVMAVARTTVPAGFLACSGGLITATSHPRLYAALGTAHDADYTARTGLTVPANSCALPHLPDRLIIGSEVGQPVGTTANATEHTHNLTSAFAVGDNATNRVTLGSHYHNLPLFPNTNYAGLMASAGAHEHVWGRDYGPVYNTGTNTANKDNARGAGTDNTYATARGSHSHSIPGNYYANDVGSPGNPQATGNHSHSWVTGYLNSSGAHGHNLSVTSSSHTVTGGHLPARFLLRYVIRAA